MKIYKCTVCGIIGIDEIPYCDHSDIIPIVIADTDDKKRIAELEKQLRYELDTKLGFEILIKNLQEQIRRLKNEN